MALTTCRGRTLATNLARTLVPLGANSTLQRAFAAGEVPGDAAKRAEAPPAGSASPVASTSGTTNKDEEWSEVIDEASGKTYYWNQATGETTDLGAAKPKSRFSKEHYEGYEGGEPFEQQAFQEGWRESPQPDRTFFYTSMGVLVGVFAGWATQFMH